MNQRYHRTAGRRRSQERQGGDAIVTAVTIQVILSVILVLLAAVAKRADEENYGAWRARYQVLATDPAEGEKLTALFSSGGVTGWFAGIEESLGGILAEFSGREPPAREETPADPPPELEVVTEATGAGGAKAAPYHYLAAEGMAYLAAEGDEPAINPYLPVSALPVPAGCTLAPGILNAGVSPPVTGIITSGFAYRDHPITGRRDFHNGVDVAAGEGDAILAPLPGEVEETGWSDIYGNYLILRHEPDFETFYGHCSEVSLKAGAAVRQGDAIGLVGGTGMTTGSHLHFSVIVGGQFTDPYWVLRDCIRPVE